MRLLAALALGMLALGAPIVSCASVGPAPAAGETQDTPVETEKPIEIVASELAGPLALYETFGKQSLMMAGFEKSTLETRSGRLAVWRAGEGPPLVFLHGAGDTAAAWYRVAPGFRDRYRVTVVDLPGHGESDPAEGPLSMDTVLAGVEDLVKAETNGATAVLVGNSLGAWLATLVARAHPERVARVVAVNGGPLRNDPGDLSLIPADREAARRLMAHLRDPASPPVPDMVLDDIVRQAGAGPIARLAADLESMEGHLLDGKLDSVRVPVDVVWGASDRLIPLAYAERLVAGLPAARLTTLEACGHVPQNECPQKLAAVLTGLLEGPAPGPKQDPPPPAGDAGEGGGGRRPDPSHAGEDAGDSGPGAP